MPNAYWIHGFERAMFWTRHGTTGACTGTGGAAPAAGADSGAYVCSWVRSANFNQVAADELQQKGGDKIGNVYRYGTAKLGAFDIQIDQYDAALKALIDESTENVGNAAHPRIFSNPSRSGPRNLGVAIQQKATRQSDGNLCYLTTILPSCLVTFFRGGAQYRGESLVNVNVSPQIVKRSHDGMLFTAAGLNAGLTDDETDAYELDSLYPIHIMSHIGNTGDTEFTTIYKPISEVVTVGDTPNELVIAGTRTALTSIVAATGVATLTAAGNGSNHVLTYQTNFVSV